MRYSLLNLRVNLPKRNEIFVDRIQEMKKLLIVFGIFDTITLARNYSRVVGLVTSDTYDWIVLCNILLFVLLIPSSYFLVRQNKIGLWLYYGQFPLRLAFQTLSFGFLWPIVGYTEDPTRFAYIAAMILGVLEIARLVCSIFIHRKYFSRKQ